MLVLPAWWKQTLLRVHSFFRVLLPLLVVGGSVALARYLIATKPEPRQRPPMSAEIRVEGVTLQPREFQVVLRSQGTVRPRTESTIIPEVSGRILEVSPSLFEGAYFEKGDVLVTIDSLDYETALTVAQGNVAQASSDLAEEEARAVQARENWVRLGKTETPSDLVLRKPQLARAQAALAAACAQLEKAGRDLERTKVRAPYAGRIVEKSVDRGQYITPGTVLARAFAVDFVEVRLPLTNEQLAFVDLPEPRRGADSPDPSAFPAVTLLGQMAGREASWSGRVVRIDGAIDARTRQLFVVTQVNDPYAPSEDGRPPLKIGLFVEAEIEGRLLEDALVLPRAAVRADNEVVIIDGTAGTIHRRTIRPLWGDDEQVIVSLTAKDPGLKAGEILCITPIAFPANGAKVLATIDGKVPAEPRRVAPPGRPGKGDGATEKGPDEKRPGGGGKGGRGEGRPPR